MDAAEPCRLHLLPLRADPTARLVIFRVSEVFLSGEM
jgi:hypothetical protein